MAPPSYVCCIVGDGAVGQRGGGGVAAVYPASVGCRVPADGAVGQRGGGFLCAVYPASPTVCRVLADGAVRHNKTSCCQPDAIQAPAVTTVAVAHRETVQTIGPRRRRGRGHHRTSLLTVQHRLIRVRRGTREGWTFRKRLLGTPEAPIQAHSILQGDAFIVNSVARPDLVACPRYRQRRGDAAFGSHPRGAVVQIAAVGRYIQYLCQRRGVPQQHCDPCEQKTERLPCDTHEFFLLSNRLTVITSGLPVPASTDGLAIGFPSVYSARFVP
jgi:hypothetical protein